jgi:hypothetical protein
MMTMTDSGNLNLIIDELRKPREVEEISFVDKVRKSNANLRIMFEYGWPYQDIMESDEEELSGIPIELAQLVLIICEFCADHNIDLVDALALVRG